MPYEAGAAGLCSGPNRKRCRGSLRRALPPQCKTSRPIPHRKERIERRVKVGRAVHCASGLVMPTQLLGWNPAVRAPTGAAWPHASVRLPFAKLAGARLSRPQKTCGQDGHPPNPATRRAGVHARRNNTVLNPATSRFPTVCCSHTAKDLKPILVTGGDCGQDGRAPNLPKGVESW